MKQAMQKYIPYGRQCIEEEDIAAVVDVLRSDWLTTGPKVAEFEWAFAGTVGAQYAVALSSGTAALHAAVHALGLGPGDEAITTPYTFAATANCLLLEGARPVFADVCESDLNIDPAGVRRIIDAKYRGESGTLRNRETGGVLRAIIPVHFAGCPAEMDELAAIAREHNLIIIEDASHALGAKYENNSIGSCSHSRLACFSTHPVKHIATGEGGLLVTNDEEIAARARRFRNHGITTDARERAGRQRAWYYEMTDLGLNYRLTDIQCALGLAQLPRLGRFLKRRAEIADKYYRQLGDVAAIILPGYRRENAHAWHLFVMRLRLEALSVGRDEFFSQMREMGIGVNVHYIPVHLHPYYRRRFGTKPGDFPVAEAAFAAAITLPLFPLMTDDEVDYVVNCVRKLVTRYSG
ncbi:MAG: UDP-4-amino-4,6-dideoxy-N-acetyl-beta-L-altrosamine transaminase [Planctomycetota bacterium]